MCILTQWSCEPSVALVLPTLYHLSLELSYLVIGGIYLCYLFASTTADLGDLGPAAAAANLVSM